MACTSEDIQRELHAFASHNHNQNLNSEVVNSALMLLQHLPATRRAVLDYIRDILQDTTKEFFIRHERPSQRAEDSLALYEKTNHQIQAVLETLIKTPSREWAKLLSVWSIEHLGDICSTFSHRKQIAEANNMHELLQIWLSCPSTKFLTDVASQSFMVMIELFPDECVDALLQASVLHSPHMDWVVAHIGSCFPQAIATRIFACGLKDFCSLDPSAPKSSKREKEKAHKFSSAVNIMEHMAIHHAEHTRKALNELLHLALLDSQTRDTMHLPYLLQLAIQSPILLPMITSYFLEIGSTEVLNNLCNIQLQQQSHAFKNYDKFLCSMTNIVLSSSENVFVILKFLLDHESNSTTKRNVDKTECLDVRVAQTCGAILDHVCRELQRTVYSTAPEAVDLPMLHTLTAAPDKLCAMYLHEPRLRRRWLGDMLTFACIRSGYQFIADVTIMLLKNLSTEEEIEDLLCILGDIEIKRSNAVLTVVRAAVYEMKTDDNMDSLINNLKLLCELSQRPPHQAALGTVMQTALCQHMDDLSQVMLSSDVTTAGRIQEVLLLVGPSVSLAMPRVMHLSTAGVEHCFNLLALQHEHRRRHFARNRLLLERLCGQEAGQRLVLRLLVEGALSARGGRLLGRVPPAGHQAAYTAGVLLSEQNRSLGVSRSGVFHAGVIGEGLRLPERSDPPDQMSVAENQQEFCLTLWQCSCAPAQTAPSPAHAHSTALLLVELVAPDCMYNGLLWPDEEFTKTTIERDLKVKQTFDSNPVLWQIMDTFADVPGLVEFSSALLRSITAVLLAHWDSCRHESAADSPAQLADSCAVIHILRRGCLLPEPLCYCADMFGGLAPFEVHRLLQQVWRYLRDNPPRPDVRDVTGRDKDKTFVALLRMIAHRSIDKFGHLYSRFVEDT